jgi:hypothetical protein
VSASPFFIAESLPTTVARQNCIPEPVPAEFRYRQRCARMAHPCSMKAILHHRAYGRNTTSGCPPVLPIALKLPTRRKKCAKTK